MFKFWNVFWKFLFHWIRKKNQTTFQLYFFLPTIVCKNKKRSCRKWKDQCHTQVIKDNCPETCNICRKYFNLLSYMMKQVWYRKVVNHFLEYIVSGSVINCYNKYHLFLFQPNPKKQFAKIHPIKKHSVLTTPDLVCAKEIESDNFAKHLAVFAITSLRMLSKILWSKRYTMLWEGFETTYLCTIRIAQGE